MRITFRSVFIMTLLALMAPTVRGALVGHWTFDEGSGATAYDSSGKGYDGTISGASYVTGMIGSNALRFDGVDDHVEVPYCDDLALVNTEYTISFWIKPDTSGTYETSQIYIGNNDMNDYVGGYAIYRHNDIYARAAVCTGEGTKDKATFISQPETDAWTHLAMVYDGTAMSVYANGELDYYEAGLPSTVTCGPIIADNTPYDPLWFGALFGYDWYHYKGAMDDVKIYNHALTPEELEELAAPLRTPGDTDGDGVVDSSDAATLAENWLASGATWSMGDFNGDQVVDDIDATILATNWNQSATSVSTSVPEPSAAVLFIMGVFALLLPLWRKE